MPPRQSSYARTVHAERDLGVLELPDRDAIAGFYTLRIEQTMIRVPPTMGIPEPEPSHLPDKLGAKGTFRPLGKEEPPFDGTGDLVLNNGDRIPVLFPSMWVIGLNAGGAPFYLGQGGGEAVKSHLKNLGVSTED